MLGGLKVTRRSDGRAFDIAGLWVSRKLTSDELTSGHVIVDLHLPLVIIIRVAYPHGEPTPHALLSIGQPSIEPTWEPTVDEKGELMIFGRPGHYRITLARVGGRWLSDDRVTASFVVQPDERGERLITLRAPALDEGWNE
jgi:hypothetical protein